MRDHVVTLLLRPIDDDDHDDDNDDDRDR